MKTTIASEALGLAEDILKDIELSRCPLSETCMKAVRLARLTGDVEMSEIFTFEASGYPSPPNGLSEEIFEMCRKAGRVRLRKKSEDDEELVERTSVLSIDQMQSDIETSRLQMEFGRPQAVNIASANPNQYVSAPVRDFASERQLAKNLRDNVGDLSSRRTFIYDYALAKNITLKVSSAAESIFEVYRMSADAALGKTVPDELKRLESIDANLDSENKEDWANAVHSCRRLLQAVADSIYPPKAGETVETGGRKVKIGTENYINRLVLYCEQKQESKVFEKMVGSNLRFIGERLDAIFLAVQKGSHAMVTLSEARRYVIYTYLVVGDILSLSDECSDHDIQVEQVKAHDDKLAIEMEPQKPEDKK